MKESLAHNLEVMAVFNGAVPLARKDESSKIITKNAVDFSIKKTPQKSLQAHLFKQPFSDVCNRAVVSTS